MQPNKTPAKPGPQQINSPGMNNAQPNNTPKYLPPQARDVPQAQGQAAVPQQTNQGRAQAAPQGLRQQIPPWQRQQQPPRGQQASSPQPNNPQVQPQANNQVQTTQPGPQTQAPPNQAAQPVPPPAIRPNPAKAPAPKSNPNSAQNSMSFAEIRDGMVIMNDGSFRAVVMAKSINFDLMSPAEQDGIEYAYQGFLNSLYFDVQILIQSRKIDMGPYIRKLDGLRAQQDNLLLSMLMDDYIDFIDELVTTTNIMDKKFFVVIPYVHLEEKGKSSKKSSAGFLETLLGPKKNQNKLVIDEAVLRAAKDELKNRVQSVVNGLGSMGIQSADLGTKELIELFYNSYNIESVHGQPISDPDELSALAVTKGEGRAKKVHLGDSL